jgi:hypothetical protein
VGARTGRAAGEERGYLCCVCICRLCVDYSDMVSCEDGLLRGRRRVLISTDVWARGLDVQQVCVLGRHRSTPCYVCVSVGFSIK